MNVKQIHRYVQHYLEATDCRILEKSPAHFKVKLSPQADRVLTGRSYYWSFVDRTGAEPETMSFLFVTDKHKYDQASEADQISAALASPDHTIAAADAAIGRSLGHMHGSLATVRMPREDIHFGSRRLEQIFEAAQTDGSYVFLFQEPTTRSQHPLESTAYTPWLGVNLVVGFQCDRKREEFHSFGVSLATGQCVEQFHDRLSKLKMTPRLPANVHVARNGITLNKALSTIETLLERKLRAGDFKWAEAAAKRLELEQQLMSHYYEPLLKSAVEGEVRQKIEEQYKSRQAEIDWQFRPRVTVSAINCGIFHLQGID
ncbi:hypothetical protein EBB07_25585 [Paenibacillaceae bacterium]|nr:hypothetical protein EBB07_25585 [Paenibacillaceae bacterium]